MLTFFNAIKRILVGRPYGNERLSHTLLPKRIALPVYASDALSSAAYAPDEILLTLALAGVSAVTLSPWVGLAVIIVLLTVVASPGWWLQLELKICPARAKTKRCQLSLVPVGSSSRNERPVLRPGPFLAPGLKIQRI